MECGKVAITADICPFSENFYPLKRFQEAKVKRFHCSHCWERTDTVHLVEKIIRSRFKHYTPQKKTGGFAVFALQNHHYNAICASSGPAVGRIKVGRGLVQGKRAP